MLTTVLEKKKNINVFFRSNEHLSNILVKNKLKDIIYFH